MGNCGTREENAVVAAHAQGILPSLLSDFLGTLVGGTLDLTWALRIASKFDSWIGSFWFWVLLVGWLAAVCQK
jgi:hypothetical protein